MYLTYSQSITTVELPKTPVKIAKSHSAIWLSLDISQSEIIPVASNKANDTQKKILIVKTVSFIFIVINHHDKT